MTKKNRLITNDVFFILDQIEKHGYTAKIVGGAVRDCLLGLDIHDIDIATTSSPIETMSILADAGCDIVPVGINYGTVLAVYNGTSYEITTLRKDVRTFGRRADVEFTDSFEEDAVRRDFTINALYMDKHGEITDFYDGRTDLLNRKVRFIGSIQKRIEEDFLRILRYFRFVVHCGSCEVDHECLAVINNLRDGLLQLSSERIVSEMLKFFQYEDSYRVVPAMRDVLRCLFGCDTDLIMLAARHGFFQTMSAEERFCMLLKAFVDHNATFQHFPKTMTKKIALPLVEMSQAQHQLKKIDSSLHDFYMKYLVIAWLAADTISVEQIDDVMQMLTQYSQAAVFPIHASMLQQYNLSQESLGKVMKETRLFWLENDQVSTQDCLELIKKLI